MATRALAGINFRSFLIVAVLSVCSGASASAIPVVDTLLARQDYRAANAVLHSHLDSFPDDYHAVYMRVAVEQTRVLDYESWSVDGDKLFALADSVRTVLASRTGQLAGKDSLQCLFYLATVYGCMSVIQAKTGDLYQALKNSIESVGILNEVVRIDPGFSAAYMGIGLFHYYLSKSFNWLPFIDANSQQQGISKLIRSTKAGFPYDFAAKNSLCWVYIERKKFAKADSVAREVLQRFPGNTIFLRIRCCCALWDKKYTLAVDLGKQLLEITRNRQPENWSDLVLAHYVTAGGYAGLGKKREAAAMVDGILGMKIPGVYREMEHIKKNLRRIRSLNEKQ